MKRFLAISLLSIFILQNCGYFLIFKIEQSYIRTNMMVELQTKRFGFSTLTLTPEQFNAAKINEFEISYKNEMYDIKSMRTVNGKIEITAICDTKEKQLTDAFQLIQTDSKNNKDSFPKGNQLKYFSFHFTIPSVISLNYFSNSHKLISSFISVPLIGTKNILSPPPRLV